MENLFIPKYLNRDVLLTVTLPRLCIPQYFCRLLFLRGHSSIISKTLPVLHFSKTNSQNRLFYGVYLHNPNRYNPFQVVYFQSVTLTNSPDTKPCPHEKWGSLTDTEYLYHGGRPPFSSSMLILSEFFSCQWWMSINSTHWALYRVNLFTIVCLLMSHLSTGT